MSEEAYARSLNGLAGECPGPADRGGEGDGPIEDRTAPEMEFLEWTDHSPLRQCQSPTGP
jgi:hypothetical protein